MPVYPRVSIILVNYNSQRHIDTCLQALRAQSYDNYEVIIVDNASVDGSPAYIESKFPEVNLIRADENLGFAGGNNLGAMHASGEYLAFLNLDTRVDKDWLQPLVKTMENDPNRVGMVTSKILLLENPDRINTCGNEVHYTGFGYLNGWQLPAESINETTDVAAISGAAFLISTELFLELGGFDEDFFPAYAEDTDLSWRVRLAGYCCLTVPESIVYHSYQPSVHVEKYHWLERNRHQLLLKNLRWRTLILLLPTLITSELISLGFAILNGRQHIFGKMKAYFWILKNRQRLMARRQSTQALRRAKDHDLLEVCTYKMPYQQTAQGIVPRIMGWIFDPFYYLWYRLCLATIRW